MAELETLDAFGNHRGTVIEVQIFEEREVGIKACTYYHTYTSCPPTVFDQRTYIYNYIWIAIELETVVPNEIV